MFVLYCIAYSFELFQLFSCLFMEFVHDYLVFYCTSTAFCCKILINVWFKPRLHDTTCCQTFVYTIQPVVKRVSNRVWLVQPVLTTGWTNSGCSLNTVVKPVLRQMVWQPAVSCKRYISETSNAMYAPEVAGQFPDSEINSPNCYTQHHQRVTSATIGEVTGRSCVALARRRKLIGKGGDASLVW